MQLDECVSPLLSLRQQASIFRNLKQLSFSCKSLQNQKCSSRSNSKFTHLDRSPNLPYLSQILVGIIKDQHTTIRTVLHLEKKKLNNYSKPLIIGKHVPKLPRKKKAHASSVPLRHKFSTPLSLGPDSQLLEMQTSEKWFFIRRSKRRISRYGSVANESD